MARQYPVELGTVWAHASRDLEDIVLGSCAGRVGSLVGVGVAASWMLACGGPSTATGPQTGGGVGDSTGITAGNVGDFLASISVDTHVGQGVDAAAPIATALAYAGIRNIRDDGRAWPRMQGAGVKLNLFIGGRVDSLATFIGIAKTVNAAGALLSVEGPNEPNNFPVTYQGQTSNYTTTFVPVAKL